MPDPVLETLKAVAVNPEAVWLPLEFTVSILNVVHAPADIELGPLITIAEATSVGEGTEPVVVTLLFEH